MKMEHALSRCFSVILYQIQAVALQYLLHPDGHFPGQQNRFFAVLIIQFHQIREMILRHQKRMPPGRRSQIQEYPEVLILVQSGRWDLPVCNLTENTIVVFHDTSPSFCRIMSQFVDLFYIVKQFLLCYTGFGSDKDE